MNAAQMAAIAVAVAAPAFLLVRLETARQLRRIAKAAESAKAAADLASTYGREARDAAIALKAAVNVLADRVPASPLPRIGDALGQPPCGRHATYVGMGPPPPALPSSSPPQAPLRGTALVIVRIDGDGTEVSLRPLGQGLWSDRSGLRTWRPDEVAPGRWVCVDEPGTMASEVDRS